MSGYLIAVSVILTPLIVAWIGVRVRARLAASAGPAREDCDDELREVFLTEARSALASLERDMTQWRMAPEKLDRVVPLRRHFHTLKGSGLLVGAVELGELSGKIEKLLVRVIERELAPQSDVIDLVAHAVAVLPNLVAQFAGESRSTNVNPLIAATDRLLRSPSKPAHPAVSSRSR